MPAILGLDCKVYINTDTYGTPVWAEWQCVKDTSVSLTYDEVDTTCRGAGGFKQTTITLANLEVTGTAVKEKADASFIAMDLAARSETIMDVLVLDGDRTLATTDGWRLDGSITSWVEDQNLADAVRMSFTLKPARSSNVPTPVSGPL